MMLQIFIAAWMALVVVGTVQGWRGAITVFRDYDDLALVFLAAISLGFGFMCFAFIEGWLRMLGMAAFGLAFLACSIFTLGRTLVDNPSAIWFPVALVTKLTFASLFVVNLINLFRPPGRTVAQRAGHRAAALGWLVLLTPVVLRLVREQRGVWAPQDVFNPYQRGRLGLRK